MTKKLIKNATIVNEGRIFQADILTEGEYINKISESGINASGHEEIIEAEGLHVFPGIIDSQVHFREPGLTQKDDLTYASRSAVSGGVTSFMEMPNTNPKTLSQELLEEKYLLGKAKSYANYSFFMGTSNENIEEVLKTNIKNVCGLKVFMGASTGDMLVDREETLRSIFSQSHPDLPISLHCEDETTIRNNTEEYRKKYGEDIPMNCHPLIRSAEACFISSSFAVGLAKEYNTRIHILHLSTAKEMELFQKGGDRKKKRITSEACIHHLWFCDEDYESKGSWIKWNPAIKKASDRDALLKAVIEDRIDVIATDHAPHTIEEKSGTYFKAPSGGPMVAHSLVAMLELVKKGKITLEKAIDKMTHAPADLFHVEKRGYLREGYFADIAIVDMNSPWTVDKSNINYKCGYSPMEGQTFHSKVKHTLVNGTLVYSNGNWDDSIRGMRLTFER